MAKNAHEQQSKKAHRDNEDKQTPGPAAERQQERENQTGRGSGEGKSGLQRGDGRPTGR